MKEIKITKIKPVYEDERGKIIDILDDEKILHVGMITSRKGAIRANHYHNLAKQYNYILSGKIELEVADAEAPEGTKKTYILEKDDLAYIPTKIVHKLTALEDSEFIDLNTVSRSLDGYEQDTIRLKI